MSTTNSLQLNTEPIAAAKETEKVSASPTLRHPDDIASSHSLPKPSPERLQASHAECALNLSELLENRNTAQNEKETVLYLGYGSNLSAAAFLVKRGIKPLAQMNVVAPSIRLTFNLPGIPYSEPCFGNCSFRATDEAGDQYVEGDEYRKDEWKKGLVGVVYEVTKSDYAHIIATEGGGAGYQDILVECFALSDDADQDVPIHPRGHSFKAHTLYGEPREDSHRKPSYAQPSARYLKLITDGAGEHNLPHEYRQYLENIGTYHTTTLKQKIGMSVFLASWGPIFAFIFRGGARMFLRPDGTYPKWFARLTRAVFIACWASYDYFFYPLFGDGERTIPKESQARVGPTRDEKSPLLPVSSRESRATRLGS